MIIVCKGFNSKEYYVPHYQLVKINWGSLMKRAPICCKYLKQENFDYQTIISVSYTHLRAHET